MSAVTKAVRRSAIGLGLFAIITGGTIALTQGLTETRIQEQAARAEARALFEIIPESRHDNNLLKGVVTLPSSDRLPIDGPVKAWVARKGGNPVGLIIPALAPDGYSGDIHLLVGLDLEGRVLGVRVTGHKETPGLGDRIETRKSEWIHAFKGKSLGNPPPKAWNVRKNGGTFDQFTGATITPRAVVKAVQRTLVYFRQHHATIRERVNAPAKPGKRRPTPEAIASDTQPAEHS
ncbi:electron transport complex subunit RsxG [Marinobacter daepoensis]|uniref:Ion-translocating oxidoreductase complex subunit G n=1 Tax=Marinobacter daepoensis TaxID=262077 RepID=A0ABS3BLG6_9GAMM|nr:electron transport complex subunit RsxG [Marinobacter daepoensis]MBN7771696.1 electron transport complex subunit RsxG [Marinobacter daepoensis]MBY6080874.1 electron transport complex subunit RsxG [Marinobacter daepoensis]